MELMLLLTGHLVADFVAQTDRIAKLKTEKIEFCLFHCVVYAIILSLATLLILPLSAAWLPILVIVVSHSLIDVIRVLIEKKCVENNRDSMIVFLLDQGLHVLIIWITYFFMVGSVGDKMQIYKILGCFSTKQISNAIVYTLMFVIILRPSAITVRKVLDAIDNRRLSDRYCRKETIRPGFAIGIFERIIIVILTMNTEFAAMAFVMAAKSLARHKQLEEPSFAEKYLVGTLLSVAIAITAAVTLKQYIQ